MSFYKNTFIGVYLLAKDVKKEVTRVVKKDSTGTIMNGKDLFNPNTGEKYLICDDTEVETVSACIYDIAEEKGLDEDKLRGIEYGSPKGFSLFIPNYKGSHTILHDDGEFCEDLSKVDAEQLKDEFVENHIEYINALLEEGHETKAHFGVVHYES